MSRDVTLYLEDIVEACEKIERYIAGVEYEGFCSDSMRYDAVVRNIEIIGEASRQLPDSVTAAMPEIAWRKIMGMRNILAHAYFGIDVDIVWDVAVHEVPRLKVTAQRYLGG